MTTEKIKTTVEACDHVMNSGYHKQECSKCGEQIHHLKTEPPYFAEVLCGNKRFEIRKNDRDFRVGDRLILHEYIAGDYTNREPIEVIVTYIAQGVFGLPVDVCVLSIETPAAKLLASAASRCLEFEAMVERAILMRGFAWQIERYRTGDKSQWFVNTSGDVFGPFESFTEAYAVVVAERSGDEK